MTIATKPLDVIERGELRKAESAIEKGQQTFMEVGNALMTIREGKLYREEHKTFQAYCHSRWGFDDSRARQLIAAAKVTETVTNVTLSSEAVAREVNKVPEEKRQEVVEKATEKADGKPITARAIKEAAAEIVEPDEPDTVEDWMAAANSELDELARRITSLIKDAEAINNPHLSSAKHGRLSTLTAQLRSAAGTLRAAKGAGVCTYCDGKGCTHCLKTGWLTKTALESAPDKAA
jgi:hypothetical protein